MSVFFPRVLARVILMRHEAEQNHVGLNFRDQAFSLFNPEENVFPDSRKVKWRCFQQLLDSFFVIDLRIIAAQSRLGKFDE